MKRERSADAIRGENAAPIELGGGAGPASLVGDSYRGRGGESHVELLQPLLAGQLRRI